MKKKQYKKTDQTERETLSDFQTCDECGVEMLYPWKGQRGKENCIVGRSAAGGYICSGCLPVSLTAYKETIKAFWAKHTNDDWRSALNASQDIKTKQDARDLMALLKTLASNAGGLTKALPYDKGEKINKEPTKSPAEIAEKDFTESKIAALKDLNANRARLSG